MTEIFSKNKSGHTLFEMILVLTIVALLASLAVIHFNSQQDQAAVHVTKANLESLRTAIALFYEVENMWPSNDLSNLVSGASSGTQYIAAIPKEAITNKNDVVNVATYAGGWHYDLTTHVLRPNLPDSDVNGEPYTSY